VILLATLNPQGHTMNDQSNTVWNVPNRISMARLVLSIVVFVLIPLGWYGPAFVIFVIAAATDWVDGWWARKFDQVTKLGRMLDPFCDKILICGVFILLAEEMVKFDYPWYMRITAWMAVIVVGRELLVTAIRSVVEQSGGDFSAKMAGKLKMWFQCIAAGACLWALGMNAGTASATLPTWLVIVMVSSIWLAVISTVYSGWGYVRSVAQSLQLPRS
jgi:CDP-diacylglycerol--glycerol-3-phosphate 3-phosphatidyltransferase